MNPHGIRRNACRAMLISYDVDGHELFENVSVNRSYTVKNFLDSDQAIAWLQQAVEERDSWLTVLNTWFLYDPLRSDPRFQALLKKMNFPDAPAE